MPVIRFATVRDLYQTFPIAQEDVGTAESDEPALDHLRSLAGQENWPAAVSYCAYLLPRRQAVWWGCQSLRRIQPQLTPNDARALDLAEAWVREPEEDRRLSALGYGNAGDHRAPATWMALAAGWSGGDVMPEHGTSPAAPWQTARAIRAGLIIGMSWTPGERRAEVMKTCIDNGIALALGSDA